MKSPKYFVTTIIECIKMTKPKKDYPLSPPKKF